MATSSGLLLATIYNQSQLAERKHAARYWLINTMATAVPLSAHPSPLVITTKLAAAILGVPLFGRGAACPVLPLWPRAYLTIFHIACTEYYNSLAMTKCHVTLVFIECVIIVFCYAKRRHNNTKQRLKKSQNTQIGKKTKLKAIITDAQISGRSIVLLVPYYPNTD